MAGAPPPTLNDTAPPVNLLQNLHIESAPGQIPQVDLSGVIPVVFTLLFAIWVIYTIVIIYHWMRYRHQSWFAVPAIVLHLFVSGAIFVFIMSALM